MIKREHFSCPPSGRALSLKVENVVPCDRIFGFLYCSQVSFSAVEREGGTYSFRLLDSSSSRSTAGKNTYLQQHNKPKNRAPCTIFSTFSGKFRPEGGHEKCCRVRTVTGVHQGVHIRSAKFRELDRKTKCPQEKKGGRRRASIGFVSGLFLRFVDSATQVDS